MHAKSPKLLDDIVGSCAFIARVTANAWLTDYESDLLFRSAVERHFEIIGEAVNRLRRSGPRLASRMTGFPDNIGMRNALSHAMTRSSTVGCGE
jgi:uncharacterized protein with HEPN domain